MTEGHELNRPESLRSNSAALMTTGSRDHQQAKTLTLPCIGEKGGPEEPYRRLDLIDEYTPKKSLVVTPAKIAAFYTTYQQQSDMVPFCEHLLVQKDSYSRPRVPALSLNGFARYLAICVLAYPNEEIRRLDRIFMDLPLAMDVVELNGSAQGILKTIPEAYRPMKHDPELRKRLDDAFEMLMVGLKMPTHMSREYQYTSSSTSRRSREFDDYFGLPSPGYSV
ncbi:hypothetical protein KJ359_002123 [Pestalotiopsis sp. 9143b]|nr:hypothetical protein KJ359_002123 [Pestalotiopsis sp. 9143b]